MTVIRRRALAGAELEHIEVGVERLTVPSDLTRAFGRYARAASYFDAFPRSSKRIILEWIESATTDATRRKRVDEAARLAANNERANHWR